MGFGRGGLVKGRQVARLLDHGPGQGGLGVGHDARRKPTIEPGPPTVSQLVGFTVDVIRSIRLSKSACVATPWAPGRFDFTRATARTRACESYTSRPSSGRSRRPERYCKSAIRANNVSCCSWLGALRATARAKLKSPFASCARNRASGVAGSSAPAQRSHEPRHDQPHRRSNRAEPQNNASPMILLRSKGVCLACQAGRRGGIVLRFGRFERRWGWSCWGSWLRSARPAGHPGARLRAQLAKGDFSLGLAVAGKAPSQEQHDTLLARIADLGPAIRPRKRRARCYDSHARVRALARVKSKRAGAQGGATQADFDSLINLITSTVKPTSWDTVGGPARSPGFPRASWPTPRRPWPGPVQEAGDLAALYQAAAWCGNRWRERATAAQGSRSRVWKSRSSGSWRPGADPTRPCRSWPGCSVCNTCSSESGDLVLVSPPGDWKAGEAATIVAADTGEPCPRGPAATCRGRGQHRLRLRHHPAPGCPRRGPPSGRDR